MTTPQQEHIFVRLIKAIEERTVTPQKIKEFLDVVLGVIVETKKNFDRTSSNNIEMITKTLQAIDKASKENTTAIDSKTELFTKEINDKISEINTLIEVFKQSPKENTIEAPIDEGKIIEEILAKINLPEYEVFDLDGKGESIVKEINLLPTDKDNYKIGVEHISGFKDNVKRYVSGVNNRFFGNLIDVDFAGFTYLNGKYTPVISSSFESVSKNIKSYPYILNYTGSQLTSITYNIGGGTITKTLSYTGSQLTSIVLSGSTPTGISLTKTLGYSGSTLSSIAYS